MGTKYNEREIANREHNSSAKAKKTDVTHIGGEAQGALDLNDYIPNLDEKLSDLRKAICDDMAQLMIILQPIEETIHDDETVTTSGTLGSNVDIDRKKHVELDIFVDANAAPLPAGSTLQYHIRCIDSLSGEIMEAFDSEVIDGDTINALGEGLKEWASSVVIDATVHKIGKLVTVAWTRGGSAGDWPHVSANLLAK